MPKYVELSASIGLDMTAILNTGKKLEIKVMPAEEVRKMREAKLKEEEK